MSWFSRLGAFLRRCARPAVTSEHPPIAPSRASATVAPSETEPEQAAIAVVFRHWPLVHRGAALALVRALARDPRPAPLTNGEREVLAAYRAAENRMMAHQAVTRLAAIEVQRRRARRADARAAVAAFLMDSTALEPTVCDQLAEGAIARFLKMDSESAAPIHLATARRARRALGGQS